MQTTGLTRLAAILLAALMAVQAAIAQPSSLPRPTSKNLTSDRIVFRLAEQLLPVAKVEVANGTLVRRSDWLTLLMAQIPTNNPNKLATCTGTLVGPNVVLLAAHCVDTWSGRPRRAQLLAFGQLLDMRCEMHPAYAENEYRGSDAPRGSHDYALCLLESSQGYLPAEFNKLSYEVIDTQVQLSRGDPVLMMGFGCRNVRVSTLGTLDWDSSDYELSVGDARVDSPAPSWRAEPAYLTIRADPLKDPGLCPGDSGGPLFSGITAKDADNRRRIRGVNSRICSQLDGVYGAACASSPQPGNWTLISSISATSVPEFESWARSWAERHSSRDAVVCGVNRDAGDRPCRR